MSLAIVALFLWTFLKLPIGDNKIFIVNLPAAILAAINMIICIVSYFWVPKKKYFPVALIIYLLLSATAGTLILSTGNLSSPFITLWMLISIFAGVFGPYGTVTILITISVFTANLYMNGELPIAAIVAIAFNGLIPLIAGAIVWYSQEDKDDSNSDNRAYRNLANELTEVASKSEVVINAIGDGVVAIDNQGIIQLINPAAQSIIGWGKQDALALNYKSVLQLLNQKNEALESGYDPIQQVLNINQQIRTNELSILTSSGKKLMISLVVSPVGDNNSGVIAVFHDITNEKAAEREQAEFISTASHEMRTPVASIEGYLGLALNPQTASVDIRARDYIMKAHASAEHLGHLFQDLLDVSKADDGRISNNPKVVNIVEFTHEIVQGLEQKAADKGLHLSFIPIPDDATERTIAPVYSVNLDNDHIREIINNLVENAIKYTPKGEVTVDITGDDDHVIVSVKDSGIGIPVEDMSHLFQKFYRVDNKDTREIGGTGLGLYLSRRLAEILGGRIWAESTYTRGSTFFVEFPRISNQEASSLIDQQTLIASEEANQKAMAQTQPATFQPTQTVQPVQTSAQPAQIVNNVPRGQALTPEQIAQYVARQRALVAQQQQQTMQPVVNAGQRPQNISVPQRIQ